MSKPAGAPTVHSSTKCEVHQGIRSLASKNRARDEAQTSPSSESRPRRPSRFCCAIASHGGREELRPSGIRGRAPIG
jgi:hypothetical protein